MDAHPYPFRAFGRANRLLLSARRRSAVAHRLLTPGGAAAAVVVAFIGLTAWWLAVDTGVPDWDGGKHLIIAFGYHDMIRAGDLLGPFNAFNVYPPLVHLIGAIPVLISGPSVDGPILVENLVFVPALALGTYKAASIAYDRRVGALAVVFALAVPMVISQFHNFMVDMPMAAIAALSVWLLLASDRFSKLGYSLAAGATIGAGLMTKNTFGLFVVGLVLMMVLRGGWRHWRNVLMFGGVAAAIAVPWMVRHVSGIASLTGGAAGTYEGTWWSRVPYPDRWSLADFAWYGWNLVNNQLYLPLTIFFGIGLVATCVWWLRGRYRDDYTPELIAGGFVGYFLVALISLNDPRYTLPCLVYVAVLSTAWIVRASPVVRATATVALLAILVVNTATITFGLGSTVRIDPLDGPASPIRERQLTVVSHGYFEGAPRKDNVLDVMRAARKDGARHLFLAEGHDYAFFNGGGLTVFMRMSGLQPPRNNDRKYLGHNDVSMIRRYLQPGDPRPCTRFEDGSGVYLIRGRFEYIPFENYKLYCPLHPS
jgi:4-amino-4-deoxy-L-arabinose transferase-like glycosyltransferase